MSKFVSVQFTKSFKAYVCDQSGDASGRYYQAVDVDERISSLEAQLAEYEKVSDDGDAFLVSVDFGEGDHELSVVREKDYSGLKKQIRDLEAQNKELRERVDAFLDDLRCESLPDWAARKIYEFDKALSRG